MMMTKAPPVGLRAISSLSHDPRNARTHSPEQIEQIAASINEFGFAVPIAADANGIVRAGNGRLDGVALLLERGQSIRWPDGTPIDDGMIPAVDCSSWSEAQCRAYALADNKIALNAGWDQQILDEELAAIAAMADQIDLRTVTGFDDDEFEAALRRIAGETEPAVPSSAGSLAREFLIPPFSVLNAREGWWQDRKRAWLSLGIQSEVGRGENLLKMSDTMLEPDPEKRAAMQAARASGTADTPPGESTNIPGALTVGISMQAYGQNEKGKMKNGKRKAAAFGQDLMRGEGRPLTFNTQDWVLKKQASGEMGPGLSSGRKALGAIPAGMPEQYTGVGGDLPASTGTSIFDPVLCEIAYRWFAPMSGVVLDPFAGGSVRGIVAAALGREYIGIDLRPEQIEANAAQWPVIESKLATRNAGIPDIDIDTIEGFQVVRDDHVAGGTKRRALMRVIGDMAEQEFVYATPAYGFAQIALAEAARDLGKRATIFVAKRAVWHPRTIAAASAGAQIIEVDNGYLATVQKRAREYAKEAGAYLVPFGMDAPEFVNAIADIAREIPGKPTEVWTVAGSGVLTRALQQAWPDAEFHAVQIGREPNIGKAKLWVAPEKFEEDAASPPPFPSCSNYDAKAWDFIRKHASPGALFWNVGADQPDIAAGPAPRWVTGDGAVVLPQMECVADFIFSCPPYGDLEVYSDMEGDISALEADEFDKAYADIIAKACAKLADDRFACFIVGDYRDAKGAYRNFVSKTIAAFEAAGLKLYNEAILITAAGSLAIRAAKQFRVSRKLGKTHQNILVFVKGDAKRATLACGTVDVSEAMAGFDDDDAPDE
jgi:hypothetical protein